MIPREGDPLSALRGEIERHPAVNHIFLHRCATSPFAREDYRVFGEQHFPLACFFETCLSRVLRRAEGRDARERLSPLVEASRAENDRALYERFLRAAKSAVPGEATVEVHRPAYRFIKEIQRIAAKEPLLVALGATAPIAAWAAPRMFASILPGLRRAGFSEEEIRYFARHEREG